jgi:prophage antirepressor-like protein
MNNMITTYNFNGAQVRVLGTKEEPLFIAKDICDALGLENATKAILSVDSDDLTKVQVIDSMGREQETNALTESGMYTLVLRSNKPEAKSFKKWVTSEVLPSIRKTGMFATDALLDDPELLLKTVTKLSEERKLRIAAQEAMLLAESDARQKAMLAKVAEQRAEDMKKEAAVLKPKADDFQRWVNSAGYITWQDCSVALGLKANQLTAILKDKGLITPERRPTSRLSTKTYQGQPILKPVSATDSTGRERMHFYPTTAGMHFFSQVLDHLKIKRVPIAQGEAQEIDLSLLGF